MNPEGIVLHWYHSIVAIGGLLAVFATFHRIFIAPVQAWRKKVEQEHADFKADVRVWKAEVEGRFKHGEGHFTQNATEHKAMMDTLKRIEDRLRALETSFAGVAPALTKE